MAKILISMPDEFLNKVDKFADNESFTRSELIRMALRNYMFRFSGNVEKEAEDNAKILENILE